MNITLSADKECIRKSREYAREQGTSLNQLIRDYLSSLIENNARDDVAEEFARFTMDYSGCSAEGYVFNRDEIHSRREVK
jgi:hypothetical protein